MRCLLPIILELKGDNMPVWMFWLNLVVVFLGVAAAWTPTILRLLRRRKIYARIISREFNRTESPTKSLFVFKLSILVKNKPINLKRVSCKILDEGGNLFVATAANNWLTKFYFEEVRVGDEILREAGMRKLIVSSKDFLNNRAVLLPGENIVGYLSFDFTGNLDRNIHSTTFIFEDFEGGSEKVEIEESKVNSKELLYEDSIWEACSSDKR